MSTLLTTAQAAQALAVHPVTLRRWAHDGRMPAAVRVGARWRFDADLLTAPLDDVEPEHRERPHARPGRVSPSLNAALEQMVGAR